MIDDVPKPRLPFLQRAVSRHGRVVWYVRQKRGHRVRIRAPYGTPEFIAEYQRALSSTPREKCGPDTGSLAWLIARFRESSAWTNLSPATRYQREPILKQVLSTAGHERFADITRKHIQAGIERRSATPYQARHFRDVMRALFQWAISDELVTVDPTQGVKLPRASKAQRDRGFEAWTDDDVAAFTARWSLGTTQRLAFDILRTTGLRRSDACTVGKQHVRDGVIRLRTQKTNEPITIRMAAALIESIEAGPTGELTFVCTERGRPFTVESFGNLIMEAARAAGIKKSAHGLRKYAATKMAEAGATVSELQAAFGWTDNRMANHYIRSADRERLGLSGTDKVLAMPSPTPKVRA